MLDPQSIQSLIIGSFIIGVVIGILPKSAGKLIALLTSLPLIFFLVFSVFLGTKVTGIEDVNTLIPWMIENFIPLILAYVFEGVGIGIVEGIKRKTK